MKFISRNANLMLVLRPGIPAQPITGTPAVPTLSVRFQDGVVEIGDQELIDKMLAHPGYKTDFVIAEEMVDNYHRKPVEPAHATVELKYGTPVARVGGKAELPPELMELIKMQAREMAKQMLPEMVKSTLEAMAAQSKATAEKAEAPKEAVQQEKEISDEELISLDTRKRGRPSIGK